MTPPPHAPVLVKILSSVLDKLAALSMDEHLAPWARRAAGDVREWLAHAAARWLV
jgi:hypothetical protein